MSPLTGRGFASLFRTHPLTEDRVERLQQAVKFAREEANNAEVVDKHVGDRVFGYLFA